MPLILPGNVASATAAVGYNVANSCRFDDGSSAKLTKTLGTPTTANKFTLSFWIKRSSLQLGTGIQNIINTDTGNLEEFIRFEENDRLHIFFQNAVGAGTASVKPTYMFRDTSAFYHIVIGIDTTQGTDTNRFKFWVNGTRLTAFTTTSYVDQNYTLRLNTAVEHEMFTRNDSSYIDGYIAELVYIDGQQLDADQFGEFNSDSPTIWQPIDVSELTFGDNGHYLDFEASDNLGNDANGGTDWTESGLAATDQATDTPTNNFATMNSIDAIWPTTGTSSVFSEGNLQLVSGTGSNSSTGYSYNNATFALSTGKWYWEVKPTNTDAASHIGIISESQIYNQNLYDVVNSTAYQWSLRHDNGTIFNNGSNSAYAASYAADDIVGVALDLTNSKLYFSKGGEWSDGSGSWDSTTFDAAVGAITITAAASTGNGHYFPTVGDSDHSNSSTWQLNFGNPPYANSSSVADGNGYGAFEYAPPSGFLSLCTKNLGSDGG